MKKKNVKNEVKQRRHQLIVLSFSVLLLIAGLGWAMNDFSPDIAVTVPHHPLYDNFALTSTAWIAQSTLNVINYEMTQVADDIDKGAELALTATIFSGEIAERSAFFPLTQEVLGIETNTPDPTLVARATEIVVTSNAVMYEQTQKAMFLTDVAEGVSTFTPFDKVAEDWIVEVEEQVGFSHPDLDLVVEKLFSSCQSDLLLLNLADLIIESQYHITDDVDHLAMTMSVDSCSHGTELLIFSLDDKSAELLFHYTNGRFFLKEYSIFSDFNQNNRLNFAIIYETDEDCPTSRLMVLEFIDSGLSDISPLIEEQWTSLYSRYYWTNQDIVARSSGGYMVKGYYPENCRPLDIEAIFRWNGERYAKVD